MTNKTREKLQKEFDKKYYGLSENDVWKWIEKAITQSENRILRKWRKAMEKATVMSVKTSANQYSSSNYTEFLDCEIMNSEYLKAKKEVEE